MTCTSTFSSPTTTNFRLFIPTIVILMSTDFASLLHQLKQTATNPSLQHHQPTTSSSNSDQSTRAICPRFLHNYPKNVPIRRIFIACPANTETGGPEALHQLCHVINSGGYPIKAFMLYLREQVHHAQPSVQHVVAFRRDQVCPLRYIGYKAPVAQSLPGSEWDSELDSSENSNLDGGSCYSSDLVVWPEIWTHVMDSLQPTEREGEVTLSSTTTIVRTRKRYQSAIWWLSVDNNRDSFLRSGSFSTRNDVLHLVQSAYAKEYVLSNISAARSTARNDVKDLIDENNQRDIHSQKMQQEVENSPVLDLTEFIPYASPSFSSLLTTSTTDTAPEDKYTICHDDSASKKGTGNVRIENTEDAISTINASIRDLDVVYNPLKGMHYTDEIIRRASVKKARMNTSHNDNGIAITKGTSNSKSSSTTITFHPIGKGVDGKERMSGEEVFALLQRAKVYIDFGPHPGMDRLPREAALAGCIVLTNMKGAARFDQDLPLPLEFKLRSFDVDEIYTKLKDICGYSDRSSGDADNRSKTYEYYLQKMEPYRQWIMGQESRMKKCVDKLVEEIVTKRARCSNSDTLDDKVETDETSIVRS